MTDERKSDIGGRVASTYGRDFDVLAIKWAVIENEHDKEHPDRDRCGGVGGCPMLRASTRIEQEMVDALAYWRGGVMQ